jgi:hypothetical protein
MAKWEIGSWTANYTLDLNGEAIAVIKDEHIDEGHAIAGKLCVFDQMLPALNRKMNTSEEMLSALKDVRELLVRGGFIKKEVLQPLDCDPAAFVVATELRLE